MGQSQSSSDGGAGAAVEVKTSYYTVLGVERIATDEEIKKAYRKKALELHPDRNYGNEEHATQTFAEVQSAYEVLSDPQERAWYDSHESAILRGGEPGDGNAPVYHDVKVTSADDLARIIGKFNKNVEFTDSPSGFFGFLRETFEHLAKEEEVAAQWEDAEFLEYPTFGHKDDEYQDVVKSFYAVWSGFTTVKSFSWCDRYRVSEAPDRFIRRRMEQENAKLRKDAKAEFNEAVRSLVQFVKKRDPRFVPNTQTEEERQKALRDAAAAQRKRAQEANAAKTNEAVPEWTMSRDPAEDELEGTFSESEVEEEVFECVACNKIFKSEKQMDAHEKSKKHQKAIKELQKRMRKQNAHLHLDEEPISSGANENDEELSEAAKSDEDDDPQKDSGSTQQQHNSTPPASESEDENDEYAPRETIAARLASTSLHEPSTTDTHSSPLDTPTPTTATTSETDLPSSQPAAQKKLGKAAQKRAKKAAAKEQTSTTPENDPASPHKCQGCDANFLSKTKLFEHLRENPKHAVLKNVSLGGKGGRKGKR
ncbi:uncharacterized protein MYCFIDRAFT_33651 [Pseudocercospora fijiensis CIRAD86]|uniref:J domain-containing protein n=1 Tax=Pseudocercospora fijiensis (strain CIRAD86) TaxID=383855 RepID=M3ALX7_PSEFD|nr:uncharacterized protein MYCFIDRAFT_33651 [Pseudocercospora fijiensis CIRAD86]EME78148.1 hypothetical protein MYCFIDRAFT_33651 [Pseudocercospora fijiensis CIRAD86]